MTLRERVALWLFGIRVTRLSPNDVLVIHSSRWWPKEQLQRIKDTLSERVGFPVTLLLMQGEERLSILRPSPDAHRAAN